jgi:electron transfer flavoprotein beta subunit
MKAKKKPLDIFTAADFGIDMSARLQVLKVSEPPKRKAGIKVASVADLAGKLNDLMKAN